RHTRSKRDWSSDVCSSDLGEHHHVPARFEDSHALVPHGRRWHECVPRFAHEAAPGGDVTSVAARPFRDGVSHLRGCGVRQPVWRIGDGCVNGFGWHGFHCFDAVAMVDGWQCASYWAGRRPAALTTATGLRGVYWFSVACW